MRISCGSVVALGPVLEWYARRERGKELCFLPETIAVVPESDK